jgi:1-acyl-sn-glycerol-3-phosphate acyltransferase
MRRAPKRPARPRILEGGAGAPAAKPAVQPGKPEGWLARLTPGVIRRVEAELADRLAKVPNRLNEYGYDPWGLDLEYLKRSMIPGVLAYRYWFRVKTTGIENLPEGRALIVGNHAGQVAIDGMMVGTAMILEADPPRIGRGMGEFWLPTIPWFNVFMHRVGGVVGTPKNCVDLLHNEEAVMVFPEGVRGMNKLFWQRYQLQRFGLGFMRLAIQTRSPVVPVAVVGSEEQAIAIANLMPLARLLGMPAFPVTPTWPLLGPLGAIPMPVRYYIQFGKPMLFDGDPDDEDEAIQRKVDQVKRVISDMIADQRRRRKNIFF